MTHSEIDKYYDQFISEERSVIAEKLSKEYRSAASDFSYAIWDRFEAPLWAAAPMFVCLGLIATNYKGFTAIICSIVLVVGILYTFFMGKGNIEEKIVDFFFFRFRYEQIIIEHVEFTRRTYLYTHNSAGCRDEANSFFDGCISRIKNERFAFRK